MKIYDITQEVFSCEVYPGDPRPKAEALSRISSGSDYNLSAFSMCAHNGTHLDAPFHVLCDGRTIEQIHLDAVIGRAFVAAWEGLVDARAASTILESARKAGDGCERRILIKGNAEVSLAAAEVFAESGLKLLGNESMTVGPMADPLAVHEELLRRNVVLLEGVRLSEVGEGCYWLSAAPLKLKGFDGAPCRAVLIKEENT